MKLSKLIEVVGDENISLQWVHDCMTNINVLKKKEEGRVTLAIEKDKAEDLMHRFLGQPANHVGVLVWLPCEKVDAALKGLQNEGSKNTQSKAA